MENTVFSICEKYKNQLKDRSFADYEVKFQVLDECAKLINHRVPNSSLHAVNNIGNF